MRAPERRRALTGLVVVAVFLAGAVTGAAVFRMTAGPDDSRAEAALETTAGPGDVQARPDQRRGGSGGPERGGGDGDPTYMFGQLLEDELELSAEQRSEVQSILERREEQARELFIESRNRFEEHLEEAVAEIESVLTEEQTQEFRELIESLEERFGDGDDDRF